MNSTSLKYFFAGAALTCVVGGVLLHNNLVREVPPPQTVVQAPAVPSLDEAKVREIVLDVIKTQPDKVIDSLNSYVARQRDDAQKKAEEGLEQARPELAVADNLPIGGNRQGKIDLVYFFDSNCVFCKKITPVVDKLLADNPDVRLIYREIPILTETSHRAAVMDMLTWQKFPAKFGDLHEAFMKVDGHMPTPEAVDEVVRSVLGPDAEAVLSVADDSAKIADVENVIKGNLALASKAGIQGTPYLYVPAVKGEQRGAGDDTLQKIEGFFDAARKSASGAKPTDSK